MKEIGLPAAFILVASLAAGCGHDAQQDAAGPPEPIVTVETTPVQRTTLPVTLTVDGHTEVRDQETLVSPIDGTVVTLAAEVGTIVKAGDTVAAILTRESQASIAGAKRLMEQAVTPLQQDEANRALAIAEEGRRVVSVIAGRGGVVVDKMVSAEQSVTANTGLARLIDVSTLAFVANVPLANLGGVKVGETCHVDFTSLPDRSFAGTVAAVSAQSDPGSQTTPVRIRFDGPSNALSALRMGMMGTVTFITSERPDVLVVPRVALLRDDINDTYTIYTVSADSLAHEVPVAVGVETDSLAEVSAPALREGDRVIVKGNYEVSNATRVTVGTGD